MNFDLLFWTFTGTMPASFTRESDKHADSKTCLMMQENKIVKFGIDLALPLVFFGFFKRGII